MSFLREINIKDSAGNVLNSILGALKIATHDGDGNKVTSTSNRLDVFSEDHLLAVQRGLVPGQHVIWKFGFTDTNSTATYNTVRNGTSGLYDYAIGYGVDADTIIATSSVPVSDNGIAITIIGLDADGNEQEVNTTVNTTTTETWSRVFRAFNSNGTAFTGDITISDTGTGTNLAFIDAEDQRTLQAMYTIPLGYTGYLFRGELSIGSAKEAEAVFAARPNGGVFRTVEKSIVFENTGVFERPYNPLPALTDLEVRIKPNTNNSLVTASFGILLIAD